MTMRILLVPRRKRVRERYFSILIVLTAFSWYLLLYPSAYPTSDSFTHFLSLLLSSVFFIFIFILHQLYIKQHYQPACICIVSFISFRLSPCCLTVRACEQMRLAGWLKMRGARCEVRDARCAMRDARCVMRGPMASSKIRWGRRGGLVWPSDGCNNQKGASEKRRRKRKKKEEKGKKGQMSPGYRHRRQISPALSSVSHVGAHPVSHSGQRVPHQPTPLPIRGPGVVVGCPRCCVANTDEPTYLPTHCTTKKVPDVSNRGDKPTYPNHQHSRRW